MKTVASLLLFIPTIACAALNSGATTLDVTSGSLTGPDGGFTLGGSSFAISGNTQWAGQDLFGLPWSPGPFTLQFSDDATQTLTASITIANQRWTYGSEPDLGADIYLDFSANSVNVTHPGSYQVPFTLSRQFVGFPASALNADPLASCATVTCTFFNIAGSVALDVVPFPGEAGLLQLASATYAFSAAPEPGTLALLLLGMALLLRVPRRPHLPPPAGAVAHR